MICGTAEPGFCSKLFHRVPPCSTVPLFQTGNRPMGTLFQFFFQLNFYQMNYRTIGWLAFYLLLFAAGAWWGHWVGGLISGLALSIGLMATVGRWQAEKAARRIDSNIQNQLKQYRDGNSKAED